MTFTLTRDDKVLLRVSCSGTWLRPGAVSYDGDTSLLEHTPEEASGEWLGYWLRRAARRAHARMGGDWGAKATRANGAVKTR